MFLACKIDIGSHFNEVIHPVDIAVYGTLCGIASFDRAYIRSQILDNVAFNEFLNLLPSLRAIATSFLTSNYKDCFTALDAIKPRLRMDIYLMDNVDKLISEIRCKAISQYFRYFVFQYLLEVYVYMSI